MRLANKGFVVFIIENGRKLVRITPAGRRVLALEEQKTALQLQKKKRWDKRWRVVIFDIPEYRRGTRDKLRLTMRTAGFYHQVNDTLMRLANKGFVVFIRENGRKLVRITPAGRRVLALEEQKTTLQLQKKKRWDKRWRVVIFDIPEYRRGTRDKLRLTMRTAGFYRLQDSVWIYPYDCEDFMALVKADLQIGNAVLYMVVEKIENDSKVKTHFMLS